MLVHRSRLLRKIFADNWEDFVKLYGPKIRTGIFKNVDKMLKCQTDKMGYHEYRCPTCNKEKKVFHTCKSRFCPTCGIKQTELWITQYSTLFANCEYQHLTFSPPHEYDIYFQVLRKPFFNALYTAARLTLEDWYTYKGYLPGGMSIEHTFGRDCKWHVHLHMLITCGGLNKDKTKWITCQYIPHQFLKDHFKKHFLREVKLLWATLKPEYTSSLRFLSSPSYQKRILREKVDKTWYVDIRERVKDPKKVVRYIGRYAKRPAIAESRITSYDGKMVTFTFKERRMTKPATMTLPVFEFMQRVIIHIPDTHFRVVRYFGFYANRTRGKVLPKAFAILKQDYEEAKNTLAHLGSWWREEVIRATKLDPLLCSVCLIPLECITVVYYTQTAAVTLTYSQAGREPP
jgi:hypothetical protein